MNDVRLPIKTVREGDKITKVCVEDVYKILNRVQDALTKGVNEAQKVIDSIHKEYDDYEGDIIIGTGVSQPCENDIFNEEVGNKIAFMKAKLNANIKKHNMLVKIWNSLETTQDFIDVDLVKIDAYILYDLSGIREYNPEYLENIEYELGIVEDV